MQQARRDDIQTWTDDNDLDYTRALVEALYYTLSAV